MDIFWLQRFANDWQDRIDHGRQPHAVMLTGPAGVGKRAAATWIAQMRLGVSSAGTAPRYPTPPFEHADLRWIRPIEDRSTIGIEQIRDLVADFGLTSYTGTGKVAVIEPAHAMTQNAANSLLKTLEEPPGDALLILVADRHGRLPATIFSRCQRIEIRPPALADALQWLDRMQPGAGWAEALTLAGGAPLAAIEALDDLDTHASMSREFRNVGNGSASALEVAARWTGLDMRFVLNWLARQVQQTIRRSFAGVVAGEIAAIDDSVLKRMDTRNLFCYLDTIDRLRSQPAGTYNVQLTLESLLIDWAEGLADVRGEPDGAMLRILAAR